MGHASSTCPDSTHGRRRSHLDRLDTQSDHGTALRGARSDYCAVHQGSTTVQIAARLHTRTARVSKWRQRFAQDRLPGLTDAPRSGKPVQYGAKVEKRILALLDQPPPEGYAGWNGTLLAAALQDVSKHQVWRVLRRHKIYLQRRRSWCISTDPEFASKAADIVGLYLRAICEAECGRSSDRTPGSANYS